MRVEELGGDPEASHPTRVKPEITSSTVKNSKSGVSFAVRWMDLRTAVELRQPPESLQPMRKVISITFVSRHDFESRAAAGNKLELSTLEQTFKHGLSKPLGSDRVAIRAEALLLDVAGVAHRSVAVLDGDQRSGEGRRSSGQVSMKNDDLLTGWRLFVAAPRDRERDQSALSQRDRLRFSHFSLGPSVSARASRFDSSMRDGGNKYRNEAREILNKWTSRERNGACMEMPHIKDGHALLTPLSPLFNH
ncbi:hypothetical protein ANCCEY_04489 [Ancylostoma ceylanicum]|uniref:Uncharacterized protein n=1 Tax=Ancylostoma ceylanicum TaxID=53326 RepID=A0A0D6M280_9BILA|nr:hypothetical protein ANCCEY_04489 [Ancylostoma ceylanicum]